MIDPAEKALLLAHPGMWVATRNGRVVAVDPNLTGIVDPIPRPGTVIRYVARPGQVDLWAVQDSTGNICPNCYFQTCGGAQQWQTRFGGTVVHRTGQFDPREPTDVDT